jgi:hypothetical protein
MADSGTYQVSKGLGYEQITGLSAATALTPAAGATVAVVQAESQDVRWRDDGTAPTASVGMVLKAGEVARFSNTPLASVKFIETTASAKLNVAYY